jgi:RNA polymerase sigma-70 factor (ECF subfamily)
MTGQKTMVFLLNKGPFMIFRHKSHTVTDNEFARLYEEHLDAVFSYCFFRVANRQLAEDLTADTFEQAWRDRHRYNPERASFTTWLFAIARHRIIDDQRKQGRRTILSMNGRYSDETPLPEDQVIGKAQFTHLYDLVRALPDEHQELIALKFGAGLSNRRIGELLNKNESAVGSTIYRIMQKLRQEWKTENA